MGRCFADLSNLPRGYCPADSWLWAAARTRPCSSLARLSRARCRLQSQSRRTEHQAGKAEGLSARFYAVDQSPIDASEAFTSIFGPFQFAAR